MAPSEYFAFANAVTYRKASDCKHLPSRTATCNRQRTTPRCCAATGTLVRLREQIKLVAGAERGIFGMEDEDREALNALIECAETENPTTVPTAENASAAAGSWRLVYTNLEILGRRRVRLAIGTPRKPGMVKLGDFVQTIDPKQSESRNVVDFKVLIGGGGTFTINAKYEVESDRRVRVKMTGNALEPSSLEKLLGESKALLTQIFDPTGYLDITYVDETLRIGRDDKGHVFVLEKMQ